ncbi:hypothetical protein pb186bvf_007302 [Paramecium bursaria]
MKPIKFIYVLERINNIRVGLIALLSSQDRPKVYVRYVYCLRAC